MSRAGLHASSRLALVTLLVPAAGLMAGFTGGSAADIIRPGERLPTLQGETLSGREVTLPDTSLGVGVLLLLGFTYESRHDVEAWAKRFRGEFGADSSVTYFEVPVIGGLGRLARPFIDRGMRRGTPPELHEHVITVYGGAGRWKEHVGYSERDVAYLLLIDLRGSLVWRGRGPYSEDVFRELADRVRGPSGEEPAAP